MHRVAILLVLCTVPALATDVHVRVDPTVTTGIESTTAYPTIQMALDHHPFATANADGSPGRVFIEIAPGTYHERIIVTQNHTNITLLGTGKAPQDVIITNSLNAKQAGGTFFTETAAINGDGFEADNLTFENTAGNTGQAVAAAVRADRVIFKHCRFLGHQDTLFADYGRQYYVESDIEGGVDFIFGNAAAVFDRSQLHANGPGYLTAQSRTSPTQPTGYVILNSLVTADFDTPHPPTDAPVAKSSRAAHAAVGLGRPWRPYSRVVFIDTVLATPLIDPAGWNNWANPANETTVYYAEANSKGAGASPTTRVSWSHQLTPDEVKPYLPATFLGGPATGPGHWVPEAEAARLP